MKKILKKAGCFILAFSLAAVPVQASEIEGQTDTTSTESSALEDESTQESESVAESDSLAESGTLNVETEQSTVNEAPESESATVPETEGFLQNGSAPEAALFNLETAAVELNKITVESRDNENGILVLKIENPLLTSERAEVIVPVWSEKNGQDDIVWYDAEQKADGWYVTIKAENHKYESGTYNIHFYSKDDDGSLMLLTGTKETMSVSATPKLGVSVNGNIANISLKNALNVSSSSRVYFPVWGESGGQNDIVWYEAQYVSTGTWSATIDLTRHKETGKYNVHAYVDNEGMNLLLASSFNVEAAITAQVSVTDKDDDAGTFRLKIENVSAPGGIKQILVPVWSETNGQDDIIWYEAQKQGNAWYVDVDASDHKNSVGKYNAHVYIYSNFGSSGLACYTTADVKMNTDVQFTVTKNSDQTQMTITLKNYTLKSSGNTIKFAVWGDANGQNDLVWYDAVKSGKNTWKYTVNIKDHKETGRYNIHVYECGKAVDLINHTYCTIDGISSAKIEVSNIDKNGNITLVISGLSAPSGISKVEVPVWTQKNGQDDIVWYTASKKGDNYQVTVPRKDHNNEAGRYVAHVYAYDNLGTNKLATYINFDVIDSQEESYGCDTVTIEKVDFTGGTFRTSVTGVRASAGVASVKIAVWAELNGQDDLIWYDATQNGDSWYVDVNTIKNHNVVKGTYYAHAYVVTGSGQQYLLGGTSTVMQWDLSWGAPGIDVSQWQGTINWSSVKASGIDFAMIRTGYGYDADGGNTDPKFEYNIKSAQANGIKVGVYHYSYAESVEDAIEEAKYCLSILKKANVSLDYPVAFDIEEPSRADASKKAENTEMIKAFCDYIENAGYDAIVYANPNFLLNYIEQNQITKYGIWLASWKTDVTVGYGDFENVQIWQYYNDGNTAGITGAVDMNVSFLK